VWERLVTPTEAPALVLPGLGTESCARVKREWVVRARAGTTAPGPGEADYQPGHGYYALAALARRAGDPKVTPADVTDRRQTGLTLLALIRRVQQLESLLLIPSFGPPGSQLTPRVGAPGADVTLSGTNFAVGPVKVQFGEFDATLVRPPTPTQIVARVPGGPFGAVRVRVTTAGGSVASDDTFNVWPIAPPPTFASPGTQVTPRSGRTNTQVTLTGSNLNFPPVRMRFGADVIVEAVIVDTPTATQIVIRVPNAPVLVLHNVCPIEVTTAVARCEARTPSSSDRNEDSHGIHRLSRCHDGGAAGTRGGHAGSIANGAAMSAFVPLAGTWGTTQRGSTCPRRF
jgi:IPT/TIG domain